MVNRSMLQHSTELSTGQNNMYELFLSLVSGSSDELEGNKSILSIRVFLKIHEVTNVGISLHVFFPDLLE